VGRPFEVDDAGTIILLPLINQLKERIMDEVSLFSPPREFLEQNITCSGVVDLDEELK